MALRHFLVFTVVATVLTVATFSSHWTVATWLQYFGAVDVVKKPFQQACQQDIFNSAGLFLKPLNIVYCPIMKNMHAQMHSMIAKVILGNSTGQAMTNPKDVMEMWNIFFKNPSTENMVRGFSEFPFDIANTSVELFAIVRHPIDRFLSTYLWACGESNLCNASYLGFCGRDPYCILNRLQLLERQSLWPEYSLKNGVRQLLSHFAPQTYFCQFRKYKEQYRLFHFKNDGRFRSALTDYLVSKGIDRNALSHGWGSKSGKWLDEPSFHDTSHRLASERRRLQSNKTLLRKIYEVYRVDFDLFDFPRVLEGFFS